MKEKQETSSLDLDKLLPRIGEFGKYQKLMLWLICLPACIPCSFCAFNQLFMADVPPHWCNVAELTNLSLSAEKRRELSIPKLLKNSIEEWDSCNRYAVNWTDILTNENMENLVPNTSWPLEKCNQGWEYDMTEVQSSVVADMNNYNLFQPGLDL